MAMRFRLVVAAVLLNCFASESPEFDGHEAVREEHVDEHVDYTEDQSSDQDQAGAEANLPRVEANPDVEEDPGPQNPDNDKELNREVRHSGAAEASDGPTRKTVFPIDVLAGGFREGNDVHQLWRPYGVARDASNGATYVADLMNHRIQRWMDGVPETVFGGSAGGGYDQLKFPRGIVLHSGSLYIADSGNHRILSWNIAGGSTTATLVAGELGVLYDRQGQIRGYDATCCRGGSGANQLLDPHAVFVSSGGDVYIADTGNDRVQKVSSGVMTTVAGVGMASPGLNWELKRPEGVFASSTYLYVSDTGQQRVVRYSLAGGDGVVVAGGNGYGSADNQLSFPIGIFVDENAEELGVPINNVYVVDSANHRVMRVRDDTYAATVVAGDCLESPDYILPCIRGGLHDPLRPGPDTTEELNPSSDNPPIYHFWGPSGLDVSLGTPVNITVADTLNHRVLMWYRSDR